MNWQLPAGLVAFLAGALLSLVPRSVSDAAGRMEVVGTWWPLGLPVGLVGAAILVWEWNLRR